MDEKKRIKILYIEDDLSSRMLVRKVLNSPEFDYLEAPDGLTGLKKAEEEHPDLILMDINLPDISGDELTTKIKNTEQLKEIVVVALTGLKEKHSRSLSLIAGCDGYIAKPIDVQNFPQQILQFLEGKRDVIDLEDTDFYRGQYEVKLVERLTTKVKELEASHQKLSNTFQKLQSYNSFLENKVNILADLQTCNSAGELKKKLVDGIYTKLGYDRCVFMDVDIGKNIMKINYARGIDVKKWENFQYPFDSPFFQKLFSKKQVIFVPNVNRIKDENIRNDLRQLEINQFIFAYLGTPQTPFQPVDMKKRIQPLLESFLPSLYDRQDTDLDVIMENLQEYLASETFYRAGFVFLDNAYSKKKIAPFEYRFLETFFRTTSYMYQNLLLMEQLRFLFVRAEKEAVTDALTNLFNYRYFIQQLNREISRDKRHKSKFSLIMIDIDFFKNYNDVFGHQAGDVILKRIAQTMLDNTRNSDIVARYGGEEFVIICPELSKTEATKVAEKLRQMVAKLDLPHKKETSNGNLTISLGVASFPEDGESAYRLIRSADKALYKAKESGRNTVYSVPKKESVKQD